jgi:hypothetical protein
MFVEAEDAAAVGDADGDGGQRAVMAVASYGQKLVTA